MKEQKEKAPVATQEPSQTKEDHGSIVTYTGVQSNRQLMVSRGTHAECKVWPSKPVTWPMFVRELEQARRMPVSMAEYGAMDNAGRSRHKDGPGFVGGAFRDGSRTPSASTGRDLLTFDLERKKGNGSLPQDIVEIVLREFQFEHLIYPTPSHTDASPRYRVVAPLSRTVSAYEYDGITRFLAAKIGFHNVDPVSYRVNQFMYFPVVPSDAEYTTFRNEAPWLDVDAFIASCPGWDIPQSWPGKSDTADYFAKSAKHAYESPGIIGAFNEAVGSIRDAIDRYLSDVYEPHGGNYSFIGGSTVGGLKVYDDKELAYSFHQSDPANTGHCINAFDLIRVHVIGNMDTEASGGISDMDAMQAWADVHVPEYKIVLAKRQSKEADRRAEAAAEKEAAGDPDAWMSRLAMNSRGNVQATIDNFREIIRNDPDAPFRVSYDLFAQRQLRVNHDGTREYWRDACDAEIRAYCETHHGIHSVSKYDDAVRKETEKASFDPLKDYLNGLVWDGVSRIDTMLTDFMGAQDDRYAREISRSWMLGAVERGLVPSPFPFRVAKYDYMLILKGPQGIGKSTFFKLLARNAEWFTDSLQKIEADKDTRMTLLGKWIIEIGELAGMSKSEAKAVKAFLSAEKDDFRPPYGRQIISQPRRCVFAGSSNDMEILRDATGSRRFMVLDVEGYKSAKAPLTPETVDQLWAEAVWLHKSGVAAEPSDWLKAETAIRNSAFEVTDEWEAAIGDYLTRPLPHKWHKMDKEERAKKLQILRVEDENAPELARANAEANGYELLPFVCRKELFEQALGKKLDDMKAQDAARIDAIMQKHGASWQYGGDKKQRISGYPGLERVWYRK